MCSFLWLSNIPLCICTPMITAALLTTARTWKQPRCPSTDEWIKKLWYIYTMEYYSAIERNTSESVPMRWMNLEPIIQSEVSQKEKEKYRLLMHIYSKFPLAIYFTYSNVSFHVTLAIHLTLSCLLPMSMSPFSMSVPPLLPYK